MNYSVRNIVIAVGLAACAVVAVLVYTANFQSSVNANQSHVTVLTAAKPIPAGTSFADAINGRLLISSQVVRQDQIPGAITAQNQVPPDYVASQTVYTGQQVAAGVFASSQAQTAADLVQNNMRAIQIPIDQDAGVVGTLCSGDHVDLFLATKVTNASNGGELNFTRPLMRDIRVIKAPDCSTASGTTTPKGQNDHVILAVHDYEATKILWAEQFAALWMVVRPAHGAKDTQDRVETTESMLTGGLNPAQIKALLKKTNLKAG